MENPMSKKRFVKAIGPLLLILAVGGAVLFVKTRPTAQRKKMSSMIPVVEVTELQTVTKPVEVDCLGTVIADQAVSLQAEVSGRIEFVHPDLAEGAQVRQGETLVRIEPTDYELAIRRAQAALRSARSNLRLEEGRQAVARHEMELVGSETEVDEAYRDLMLREPQLLAAEAAVEQAQSVLDGATINLARTELTAPFDAQILSAAVDAGDYAQSGRTLVELVGTARYFVRAALPIGDLKFFSNLGNGRYPARITATDGSVHTGTIYQLLPGLSTQGRMARILIAVENPAAAPRPLLLDEVVRVTLSGATAENVCLIDRSHLRTGSTLWMVDPEGRLRIVPAETVQGYADRVLVRTEASGEWKLITSGVAAPVDGMKVRTPDEPSDAAGEPGGKKGKPGGKS
jgi:RND family efflux transporter MFP subunit